MQLVVQLLHVSCVFFERLVFQLISLYKKLVKGRVFFLRSLRSDLVRLDDRHLVLKLLALHVQLLLQCLDQLLILLVRLAVNTLLAAGLFLGLLVVVYHFLQHLDLVVSLPAFLLV